MVAVVNCHWKHSHLITKNPGKPLYIISNLSLSHFWKQPEVSVRMLGGILDPIPKWWSPKVPYYVQESRLVINNRSTNHSEMINTIWAHVLPSSVCTICITTMNVWLNTLEKTQCTYCCSELLSFAHGNHQCQETTRLEKMLLLMIIHLVRSTQHASWLYNLL